MILISPCCVMHRKHFTRILGSTWFLCFLCKPFGCDLSLNKKSKNYQLAIWSLIFHICTVIIWDKLKYHVCTVVPSPPCYCLLWSAISCWGTGRKAIREILTLGLGCFFFFCLHHFSLSRPYVFFYLGVIYLISISICLAISGGTYLFH